MGRLFDTTVHHHAATATERAVDALLANRAGFADGRAFADAILAALAAAPASHEPARAAMAAGDTPAVSGAGPAAAPSAASPPVSDDLLGRIGAAMSEEDSEVRIAFFQQATACFPGCAVLRALCGDALLTADHVADAVEQLLAAFELDYTLFDEFDEVSELARSLGGRPWLRYQLAELRAIMATAEARAGIHDSSPDHDSDDDDDSDDPAAEVRERYSELLEEHSADPDAMAAIRAVGVRITALEAAGVLPQVLIRRGTWRPR